MTAAGFRTPFTIGDELISIGISLGHTIIRPDMTPLDVLAAADAAMYADKRARNPLPTPQPTHRPG